MYKYHQGLDFLEIVPMVMLACVGYLALMLVVVAPILNLTSGLGKGYSSGIRSGYITKASEKGFIWKTYECEMQIGSGEMSALQEPWQFSIPKSEKDLFDKVNGNIGKKAVVHYDQWLIMPARIGDSWYEATSINFGEE